MNTQPTPETDAVIFHRDNGVMRDHPFVVTDDFARNLERERDEARFDLDFRRELFKLQSNTLESVTAQRDEAREQLAGIENKMRVELDGHPDSELWGEAGLIAATMRCVNVVGEVTEQRDEWKAKYIQQNKDLGCELRDPNGTIWDHAKTLQRERDEAREELAAEIKHHIETTAKWNGHHMDLTITQFDLNKALRERDEARGQRDRLAEALEEIYNVSSFDYDTMPELARKKYREVVLEMADEALQSLTSNTKP